MLIFKEANDYEKYRLCRAYMPVFKTAFKQRVNQNILYVKLKNIDDHITEHDTPSGWTRSQSSTLKRQ